MYVKTTTPSSKLAILSNPRANPTTGQQTLVKQQLRKQMFDLKLPCHKKPQCRDLIRATGFCRSFTDENLLPFFFLQVTSFMNFPTQRSRSAALCQSDLFTRLLTRQKQGAVWAKVTNLISRNSNSHLPSHLGKFKNLLRASV